MKTDQPTNTTALTDHFEQKDSIIRQPLTIEVDYERYMHLLETCDASVEVKRKFLSQLCSILVNFVDLGFEVHPLQQSCEQPSDLSEIDLIDVVGSIEHETDKDILTIEKETH